jgi:F-type H+-transporting ATPase subunit b
MQINWFTVIAQIVNFIVLVWLMKRYLYKPILSAIDDREKKIAGELADAKSQKASAKAEHDEFDKKNNAFDQDKKQMMDKAVADAGAERQKLIDAAKNDAQALRDKLEKASAALQEHMTDQIAQKTQQEVIAITRKALTELASSNLEEQVVNTFIKKIDTLDDKGKTDFIKAFQSDKKLVTISSAFDLPAVEQKNIVKSIDKILGAGAKYTFKSAPEIIGGIELSTNGYKLCWSISAYISSLEKSIAAASKAKPAAPKKTRHVHN